MAQANTDLPMSLLADSAHSAGAFTLLLNSALDLSIGGHTDWYLPARYELDIAYFNLKPGTRVNDTQAGEATFTQFPKETTTIPQLFQGSQY
jgi:hypothetical protein